MRNRIKEIRWEQRLTQEALAAKTGISRSSLSQIENEKVVPDGVTIVRLVRALNIPANKIFLDLDVSRKQRNRENKQAKSENADVLPFCLLS